METQELMKTSCEELQPVTPVVLAKIEEGGEQYEISVYSGEIIKPEDMARHQVRLKAAFPRMEPVFFDLLTERVIKNKFTSQRFKDAVNHLIDNFQYKELNISDVIKFDRKIRLYTYSDVLNLVDKKLALMSDFEIKEINGQVFRVKKTDLAQIF